MDSSDATDAVDVRRRANQATLRRAMAAICAMDPDAVVAELHHDGVLQLPYEDAVPDLDRDGFRGLLTTMFTMYETFDITLTAVHDLLDPDLVVATYDGDCRGRDADVHYANTYVGFFTFRDGKILVWREFDNPKVVEASLAAFAAAGDPGTG